MRVGILAVQGAFIEHRTRLGKLGAECLELRNKSDAAQNFDGLVLPGGESTVQGKLLRELGMFEVLRDKIENGVPVLATCAGLILLAEEIENDEARHLATLPVTVRRNAFGRQLGSFFAEKDFAGLGKVPMTFIRAPIITAAQPGVEILAVIKNPDSETEKIVAVKYKNQLALSFHPELTDCDKIFEYFLAMF